MKLWIKWLIWFFLLGNMMDGYRNFGVSVGTVKQVPYTPETPGLYFVWFVFSAIAFTYYTMKIKEL